MLEASALRAEIALAISEEIPESQKVAPTEYHHGLDFSAKIGRQLLSLAEEIVKIDGADGSGALDEIVAQRFFLFTNDTAVRRKYTKLGRDKGHILNCGNAWVGADTVSVARNRKD